MRRSRWPARIAVGVVLLILLGIGWVSYDRYSTRREGEKHLDVIVARLDETDPRWRLEEIETDQPHIPDAENAALLIAKLNAAMQKGKFEVRRPDGAYGVISFGDHPNRLLDDGDMLAIDKAFQGREEALAVVRSFGKYPSGQIRIVYSPMFVDSDFQEVISVRQVFDLARWDAERLCRQGKSVESLQLVHSILNAARTINGTAGMVGALVRISGDLIAVYRLQRDLALLIPQADLAEMQGALNAEAESDFIWRAFRTERGGLNTLFEHVRAGDLDFQDVVEDRLGPPPAVRGRAENRYENWIERPYLPEEHASCLEYAGTFCELRGLPDHLQTAAAAALQVPPAEKGHLAVGRLPASYTGVLKASLRNRALLRSAAVGVAVERFRILTGSWPQSLDQIPKEILSAIPLDPFDGKPLRFVKRADGVTIYSIGSDEVDNGGNFPEGARPGDAGSDIVFRLYNPDQRGLPPLPKPKKIKDDDEGLPFQIGPEPRVVAPK
jgi:hypothetical protein